jgi:hypothetical protein
LTIRLFRTIFIKIDPHLKSKGKYMHTILSIAECIGFIALLAGAVCCAVAVYYTISRLWILRI